MLVCALSRHHVPTPRRRVVAAKVTGSRDTAPATNHRLSVFLILTMDLHQNQFFPPFIWRKKPNMLKASVFREAPLMVLRCLYGYAGVSTVMVSLVGMPSKESPARETCDGVRCGVPRRPPGGRHVSPQQTMTTLLVPATYRSTYHQ